VSESRPKLSPPPTPVIAWSLVTLRQHAMAGVAGRLPQGAAGAAASPGVAGKSPGNGSFMKF